MTGAANNTLVYYHTPLTGGVEKLVVLPGGWGQFHPVYGNVQEWDPDLTRASLKQGGWNDGWESDEEYLDNVECADCGETRVDLLKCDQCDVRDCTVKPFSCDGGGAPDGQDLCDEHTPRHSGCPHCDPRMPWEE